MRYWKCTCCSTVLITQKQESRENYCRPTCPIAACKGSNYQEISLDEFKTIALASEPAHTGDVATCFACNSPLPPTDTDVALDERMKRAGMMTVAEVLNSPMAKFQVHAGVKDLDTFNEWLIMRRDSFTRQQAKMRLADKCEGDMFEWTIAHSACFREVFYNFEVAKTVNDKLIAELKEQIEKLKLNMGQYLTNPLNLFKGFEPSYEWTRKNPTEAGFYFVDVPDNEDKLFFCMITEDHQERYDRGLIVVGRTFADLSIKEFRRGESKSMKWCKAIQTYSDKSTDDYPTTLIKKAAK